MYKLDSAARFPVTTYNLLLKWTLQPERINNIQQ